MSRSVVQVDRAVELAAHHRVAVPPRERVQLAGNPGLGAGGGVPQAGDADLAVVAQLGQLDAVERAVDGPVAPIEVDGVCGEHAAERYPLVWRVKVIRPEWFGRRCRIVIHGGQRGARLIEFEDGYRVVCPGQYLRRAA